MAKEDRPARNTTADPTVPSPRRYPDEQYAEGQDAEGQPAIAPSDAPQDQQPSGQEPTPQEPTPQEPTPQEPTPQEPTPQEPTPQEPTAQGPGPAGHQGPGSAGHALERTRLGGAWVAIGCFAVVLLFLLFFILSNNYQVHITIFGQGFDLPLGVALVLAAVSGALLVLLAGAARITQMRSRVRKHRRAQHKAAKLRAKAGR